MSLDMDVDMDVDLSDFDTEIQFLKLSEVPESISYKSIITYPAAIEFTVKRLPPRNTPTTGQLANLPLEIQQIVYSHSDILSLSQLRLVNLSTRTIIDTLPLLLTLLTHTPSTLRALHDTHTSSYHTLTELTAEISTSTCVLCGDHAPFLFLLTCERTCFPCAFRNPAFRLMSPPELTQYFGSDTYYTSRLPFLTSIPGRYAWMQLYLPYPKQLYLVCQALELEDEIYQAHRNAGGVPLAPQCYLRTTEAARVASIPEPASQGSKYLLSDVGYDRYFENPLNRFRCVGITRVPILQPGKVKGSTEVNGAYWCRGCDFTFCMALDIEADRGVTMPLEAYKAAEYGVMKAWDREGLLGHVRGCDGAKHIWEVREIESSRIESRGSESSVGWEV